jgi:hypothetical protein
VWLMRQAGRYMAEFRAYSDKYPFRMRSETPEIAIELSLQPWRAFKPDGEAGMQHWHVHPFMFMSYSFIRSYLWNKLCSRCRHDHVVSLAAA